MKLNFKEDPKEWRKSVLLTAFGLALMSTLLLCAKHLPVGVWCGVQVVWAIAAICAVLQPRWFRGWYRLSLWLGFYSSQFIGRCVLILFFIFIITPVGFILRLAGKDPLQLKRPEKVATYWHPTKDCSPLDRLF
jgi:hypothetical protein